MRSIACVMVIAFGCGGAARPREVADRRSAIEAGNRARIEAQLAALAEQRAWRGVEELAPLAGPAQVRLEPTGPLLVLDEMSARGAHAIHDLVIAAQEDGTPVLVAPGPCTGQSCTCEPGELYRLARKADGTVAVVRLRLRVETETVTRPGACGVGCGVPVPPSPPEVYALPVASRAQVEIVAGEVRIVRLRETCERPMPRP